MAGSTVIFTSDPVTAYLNYGDDMKATSLTVDNSGAGAVDFDLRIVGLTGGAEDPVHKTYGKVWLAGTVDSVPIGSGANVSITVGLNAHGKLGGFTVNTGGSA